ncbi:MAG: histidinol-phosphate transaminase [Chitinophagaceae bacterium]
MNNQINRRNWLKNTAMLSGGMAFLPSLLTSLKAAPEKSVKALVNRPFLSDSALSIETTPPEIKARLSANENPFGPSAKAKQAIKDAIDTGYRYAFFEGHTMAQKIADFEGLQPEQILLSAGSTPLLLAGALLYGKGTIVSSKPTYEDLLEKAESAGAKVVRVPLTVDYKYDLDAIEKAVDSSTALVYICNPNNPTATVIDGETLRAFCQRVSKKTMVFVDEAYIDLVPDPQATTVMPLVKAGENIIVARTFSKLYGMAGLRFGYMVAQPETIKKFEDVTPGQWSIASTTWAAALASYQDKEFMKSSYDNILASKEYLYTSLKKEGYDYIPSGTNFVCFPVREDSKEFAMKMMKNGVSVRSWVFDNKQWCRVSVGTMDEMKNFALSLAKIS